MKLQLAALFILFLSGTVNAQVYSVATGDWSTGATWSTGVPPHNDSTVHIVAGHTVTVTSIIARFGANTGDIIVEANATLVLDNSNVVSNANPGTADFIVNTGGIVNATGSKINITSGDITIAGTVTTDSLIQVATGTINISGTVNNAKLINGLNGDVVVSGTVNNAREIRTITSTFTSNVLVNSGTIQNVSIIDVYEGANFEINSSSVIDMPSGRVHVREGLFLFNAGTFDIGGDLTIGAAAGASLNAGSLFNVGGDLTLKTFADFENNAIGTVEGDITVGVNNDFTNDARLNVNRIYNSGKFVSYDTIVATDSIINTTSFVAHADIECLTWYNTGTFVDSNNHVGISEDFYNNGTLSGYNGVFEIARFSENDASGVILGELDICDATILAGNQFDINNGSYDNRVTFCEAVAGIDESTDQIWATLAPNPTNGMVCVELKEQVDQLLIMDILGETVLSITNPSQQSRLDLSHLQTGIYFVRLTDGTRTRTRKLIKN